MGNTLFGVIILVLGIVITAESCYARFLFKPSAKSFGSIARLLFMGVGLIVLGLILLFTKRY